MVDRFGSFGHFPVSDSMDLTTSESKLVVIRTKSVCPDRDHVSQTGNECSRGNLAVCFKTVLNCHDGVFIRELGLAALDLFSAFLKPLIFEIFRQRFFGDSKLIYKIPSFRENPVLPDFILLPQVFH